VSGTAGSLTWGTNGQAP